MTVQFACTILYYDPLAMYRGVQCNEVVLLPTLVEMNLIDMFYYYLV